MIRRLTFIPMLLLSASAFAQESAFPPHPQGRPGGQPQQVDPRLSGPMMNAMKAQIDLLNAALKAATEDAQTREGEWTEWVKGWFGEKPAEPPK